jgi:hypothetical protein
MKSIAGVLFFAVGIASIALGFYCGLWVCLVGGIVDIVNLIKSPNSVEGIDVALNVVRVVFFGLPITMGWLGAWLFCGLGGYLMAGGSNKRYRRY